LDGKKLVFRGRWGSLGQEEDGLGARKARSISLTFRQAAVRGRLEESHAFSMAVSGRKVLKMLGNSFSFALCNESIFDFCDVTKLFVSALAIHKLFTPFKLHSHLALD
jgi:hypothetical protein